MKSDLAIRRSEYRGSNFVGKGGAETALTEKRNKQKDKLRDLFAEKIVRPPQAVSQALTRCLGSNSGSSRTAAVCVATRIFSPSQLVEVDNSVQVDHILGPVWRRQLPQQDASHDGRGISWNCVGVQFSPPRETGREATAATTNIPRYKNGWPGIPAGRFTSRLPRRPGTTPSKASSPNSRDGASSVECSGRLPTFRL
jgi:hypothetical protein